MRRGKWAVVSAGGQPLEDYFGNAFEFATREAAEDFIREGSLAGYEPAPLGRDGIEIKK